MKSNTGFSHVKIPYNILKSRYVWYPRYFLEYCTSGIEDSSLISQFYENTSVKLFFSLCINSYFKMWFLSVGVSVLTVIATDEDSGNNGTVMYSLKQVPVKDGTTLFAINPNTGLITTTMNNALDRERQPEYRIIVQARDQGTPESKSGKPKVNEINYSV